MSAERRARLVHLTTVHPFDDTRIRWRYCEAARASGFDIRLVAPVTSNAVSVRPDFLEEVCTTRFRGLLGRLERTARAVRLVLRLNPDIVHFHDPELLIVAPLLKLRSVVVFDAHEDVEKQIGLKTWLPAPIRRCAQTAIRFIYNHIEFFVNGVVVADASLQSALATKRVATQRNFPRRAEVERSISRSSVRRRSGWHADEQVVLYLGTVNPYRGLVRLSDVVGRVAKRRQIRLVVAGLEVPTPFLSEHVKNRSLDHCVDLLGRVDRERANELMVGSDIGVSLLEPTETYYGALPTKLPEYAIAGLPILASDFPVCSEFLNEVGHGLTCDPLDDSSIERVLDELWENQEQHKKFAELSRFRVESWESDFENVLKLYSQLLGS